MSVLETLSYENRIRVESLTEQLRDSQPTWTLAPPDGPSEAEEQWHAQVLVARWLAQAEPLTPFPDRTWALERLEGLGGEATLQALEFRQWVRFVLHRLELPQAVADALRRPGTVDLAGFEPALRTLFEAEEGARDRWWLEAAQVEDLYARHASVYPSTPPRHTLEVEGWLSPHAHAGQPGYRLWSGSDDGPAPGWEFGASVAAQLWTLIGQGDAPLDDAAWLTDWLERASSLRGFEGASGHLGEESRSRLIAASQARLLTEPDLLGGGEERERVYAELRVLLEQANPLPPYPAPDSSALEQRRWWLRLGEFEPRLRARHRLDSLISVALWGLDKTYPSPLPVEWLIAGAHRPYLVHALMQRLEGDLRAQLPTLLLHPHTAPLGLALLERLSLAEDVASRLLDRAGHLAQIEARRGALWRDACGVFAHAMVAVEDDTDLGRVLGEALLLASQAADAARTADREAVQRRATRERFETLCTALANQRLLTAHAGALRGWITNNGRIAAERSPTSISMPLARLRVLSELLEASPDAPERTETAKAIVALYAAELERETHDSGKPVVWYGSLPELRDLPWDAVLAALPEDEIHLLLEPLDLVSALRRVARTALSAELEPGQRDERDTLVRAWLNKIRCHLRVLLRAVSGLQTGYGPRQREGVDQVDALLTACAAGNSRIPHPGLFALELEGMHLGFEAEPKTFALEVAEAINHLPAEDCLRTFETWVRREQGVAALLTLAGTALPSEVREDALERLGRIDDAALERFLEARYTLPEFERLAGLAQEADQPDLADRVLTFVEQLPLNESQLERWNQVALPVRDWLAFRRGNLEALERSDPDSVPGSARRTSQRFYAALLDLEDNPEQARDAFEALLKENPGSVSSAVNRFAAEVRIAARIEQPESRRDAFGQALTHWETISARLAHEALERVDREVSQLRLIALDGAGRDFEFDQAWEALPLDRAGALEFVAVRVQHALSRGDSAGARGVLERVRAYHVLASGRPSEAYLKLEQVIEKQGTVSLPVLTLPLDPNERVRWLWDAWKRIQDSPLHEHVRVLGEPTLDTSPHRFVLRHLRTAAHELLKRAHLLHLKDFDEDEYSDLLWSLLQMRLGERWSVRDQSRGGASQTGKKVGERDAVVYFGEQQIAVLEALILDSVKTSDIITHVHKAVKRYNPSGVPCVYLIVYFFGGDWSRFCESYRNFVASLKIPDYTHNPSDLVVTPADELHAQSLWEARLPYRRDQALEPMQVYHQVLDLRPV